MRRAARVDANQAEIVSALRDIGCSVLDLSRVGEGVPDLLVWSHKVGLVLLEVKIDKGKLTSEQRDFHQRWPVYVVRSIQEAFAVVGVSIS